MADMIELCARVAAALSFPPAAGEVMRQLVDASPKSPASPRARRPSGRAPGRERGRRERAWNVPAVRLRRHAPDRVSRAEWPEIAFFPLHW